MRLDDDKLVVSVMDGHGGWQAADFAQSVLNATIRAELAHATDRDDPEQLAAAMTRAYERVDREFVARIRPAFEVRAGIFCLRRRRPCPRQLSFSPFATTPLLLPPTHAPQPSSLRARR